MVDRGCLTNFQKSLDFVDSRILAQAPVESVDLPHDFAPGNCDVICSRGADSYRHVGNKRLRGIIDGELQRYENADSKMAKSIIVSDVVDGVRASSHGRGFVRQNKTTKRWHVLSDKLSREKVGQMFRAAMNKKKSSCNRKREAQDTKSFMKMIMSKSSQTSAPNPLLPRQVTPEEQNARAFMMQIGAPKSQQTFSVDLSAGPQMTLDDYTTSQIVPPEINHRLTSAQEYLQGVSNKLATNAPTLQRNSSSKCAPPSLLTMASVGSFSVAPPSLDGQVSSNVVLPPTLEAMSSLASFCATSAPPTTSLASNPSLVLTNPALTRIASLDDSSTLEAPMLEHSPSLDRVPSYGLESLPSLSLDRMTSIEAPALERHLSLLS